MPAIRSFDELRRFREKALNRQQAAAAAAQAEITVGMGACCMAAGANATLRAILETIEEDGLDGVVVRKTGCIGLCEWEPIVEVVIGNRPKVTYGKVSPERAKRIIEEHVLAGNVVADHLVPDWLLVRHPAQT